MSDTAVAGKTGNLKCLQAMPGFLEVFGYRDENVPGGWNISPTRQQLISSLMTLGAVIASGCAGPLAWKMGRKLNLWIACGLCCVANVIMMTTTSIGALYAARLLLGISNGMLMTFSQLYIQETCPAVHRGLALSAFQSWTSIGTLIGTIIDNFTAPIQGRNSYIIPLGIIFVVPFFISIGLFFIPESPRWLTEQSRLDAARSSMRWLRATDTLADAEMDEVETTLAREKELHDGVSVWDMFRNPIDRRRTIVSVAAINTQAASGAMFIIAYGTYFFQMANVGKPFENAVILTSIGVFAILVNSVFVTKFGRRRVFLMTGLSLCGLFQLIIAVIYTVRPNARGAAKSLVGLTCLYIVAYNGLIATYAWVLGGEAPSQRLRSYTFGLGASVGFFGAWLATFTAPYFINPAALNWGPKYGYIWAPSCVIAAVFTWWFIPETKGRTLEEITEMFEGRVPARKFRTYKCVGSAALAGDDKDEKSSSDGDVERVEVVGGKV
ncbi:Sugar (and other) transporter-like protein 7 [Elsinoe fawcettii]|nr:Sugar (and other) transporter-like protein 7 [Elsinoe fawcettii]